MANEQQEQHQQQPIPAEDIRKDDLFSSETIPDYRDRPAPPGASEVKYRGGVTTHFPALVHAMLSLAEADGYTNVCGWSSHGRSFSVHDRNLFVSQIMPLYFRQTQFPSFQRQLNLYGFCRLSQQNSPDSVGSYYHPMFLRSRQDLCPAIQRQTERELREMKRKIRSFGGLRTPDFEGMKPMPRIERKQIEMARAISKPQRRSDVCPQTGLPETMGMILPDMGLPEMSMVGMGMGNNRNIHMVLSTVSHNDRTTEQEQFFQLRPPPPMEMPVQQARGRIPGQQQQQDAAVQNTFTSLFLNEDTALENQLDLSWLEPTPIAPTVAATTQYTNANSSHLHTSMDPSSTRSFEKISSSHKRSTLRDGAFPEGTNMEPNKNQKTKVKRERSEEGFGSAGAGDHNKMVHFLEDIDLGFSDTEDQFRVPPHKTMYAEKGKLASPFLPKPFDTTSTTVAATTAMNQLQPLQFPTMMPTIQESYSKHHYQQQQQQQESYNPKPTSSSSRSTSLSSMSLPRTCKQLAACLPTDALVVTGSCFPYPVIYSNSGLERTFGRTKNEILDKTLIGFCSDKSEYPKLNAACFDSMLFRDSLQDKQEHHVMLTLGNGRRTRFQVWVGPFFMSDDLMEMHNPQHFVWRFHEIGS